MSIYSKPVVFSVVSAVVILIGTIITVFLPMMLPSTQPSSPLIKPYTAVELEGRDIYVREGCNNCHTQTVRALRTEVMRYGDYSKPEEFAYDRPFLWGSRRMGPDLNRIGGKYNDAWHYQHNASPQVMFQQSNMPPYAWLAERKLDTTYSFKKTDVLGYGYSAPQVQQQLDAYRTMVTAADYGSKSMRDSVTPAGLRTELTEMDALIAYLQKLGSDVKKLAQSGTTIQHAQPGTTVKDKVVDAMSVTPALAAEVKNPFAGDAKAIAEGKAIFMKNCTDCHADDATGIAGPNLTDSQWNYGGSDSEVFETVTKGRGNGSMPPWKGTLGEEGAWKVITYIRSLAVQ